MSHPSEDWKLVLERFEKNDPMAIAKITDVIIGYLHRYRADHRRSSWDDLCQEVLIALLRTVRRDGRRDPAAFIAYAGTVTRNKLANFTQRQERKDRDVSLEDEASNVALLVDAERAEHASRSGPETFVDLERALGALPDRCRRVIESIYLHGYSYEETSSRLSLSLAAVKRDQIKGLKSLRGTLGIQR